MQRTKMPITMRQRKTLLLKSDLLQHANNELFFRFTTTRRYSKSLHTQNTEVTSEYFFIRALLGSSGLMSHAALDIESRAEKEGRLFCLSSSKAKV